MRRIFALLLSCCCWFGQALAADAGVSYVVDCNGKGDYTSLQACFDALPAKSKEWRTIYVRPGVYREKLTLDVYKDKVAVVGTGETPDEVLLVWNDYSGKVVDGYEMTTYDCWTFSVQADEVFLRNLTIRNDAGRVGQAVALETRGDRIWIDRCRIEGNQDTFFPKNYVARVMVTDSYIDGTTDFIFGPSIVLFDHCHIHAKSDSYITAASTTERNKYGFVFRDCRVTTADNVTKLYLGRPWKSTARTVWLRCELPAAIRPEGWHNWNDPNREKNSYYAEWQCTGEGADRSSRVAWSHALTDEEAADYTEDNIFAKKTGSEQFHDEWHPLTESFLQHLRTNKTE